MPTAPLLRPQLPDGTDVEIVPLAIAANRQQAAQHASSPSNPTPPLLIRDIARAMRGEIPGEVDRYNLRRYLSLTSNIEHQDLGHVIDQLDGDPLLVAITGYAEDEARRRSREAGFHHHLVKPVDPDAILNLLAALAEPSSAAPRHLLPGGEGGRRPDEGAGGRTLRGARIRAHFGPKLC